MKKKTATTKENQSRNPKKPAVSAAQKTPDGPAGLKGAENKNLAAEDQGDIISLILRDHRPLKKLIETLKDDELEKAGKEAALEEFALKLTSHAKAEEQTLYVQMKEYKELRVESFEGDTEHAIADQLVQEINATPDDDEWNAKVKVLAEMVEHHIEEEEETILAEVKEKMAAKVRLAVGAAYTEIKEELDTLTKASPPHLNRMSFEQRLN